MRKLSFTPLVLILTLALMMFVPIVTNVHAAFTKLSVIPQNNTYYSDTTPVGSTFTLNVTVTNVTDLYSWQIQIYFNSALLNCTGAVLPPDHVFAGKSFIPVSPIIDNDVGTVMDAVGLVGDIPRFNGSGRLCQLTFLIKQAPPTSGSLNSWFNFSVPYGGDTFLWDFDLNEIPADYENGYLEYIWRGNLPTFKVEPNQYIAPVNYKGENFDIDVNIYYLSASDQITSAQFRLYYNTSLLEVVNVEEGAFFKQFNNTPVEPYTFFISFVEFDYVVVGILLFPNATGDWSGPFPEGNGTLATITFKEIMQPVEPEPALECDLMLADTMLLDKDLNEIPHEVEDGYYRVDPLPIPEIFIEFPDYTATHRGEILNATIGIANVDPRWRMVAIEFRLNYTDTTLEAIDAFEEPFMASFPTVPPPGPYTLFIEFIENSQAIIGIMIYPNDTGVWLPPFPSGDGALATVSFRAIKGPPTSCPLELTDVMLVDYDLNDIPFTVTQQSSYAMPVETLVHEIVWDSVSYYVTTVSTATVNDGWPIPPIEFQQAQKAIVFNWTGPAAFSGVCNITIPKALLDADPGDWIVEIGGANATIIVTENSTHTTLSFQHAFSSTELVRVIGTRVVSEFNVNLALAMSLIAALGVAILMKSKVQFKRLGKIVAKRNI